METLSLSQLTHTSLGVLKIRVSIHTTLVALESEAGISRCFEGSAIGVIRLQL